MRLLDRYLLRFVAAPFFGLVAILLFGLSLERLLRLIRLIANEGAPVSRAFELLFYLMPHYLGLAIPIGFFVAVLMAVRRLHERSELVIFFNSGTSLKRILVPLMGVSAVLAAIMLFLVAYAEPESRYAYRATLWQVQKTGALSNIQPGVFERISKKLVMRAEDVSPDGLTLGRFFAAIGEDGADSRSFMVAERAALPKKLDAADLVLELSEGEIIQENKGKAPILIHFHDYPWHLLVDAAKTYGARGQDARELFLSELITGRWDQVAVLHQSDTRAELQDRLVQIVALPFLAVLAVPLALLGRGRTGKAYGLGLGIALLVTYEQLLGFGRTLAMKGKLPAVPALWIPLAVMAVLGLYLLSRSLNVKRRRRPLPPLPALA